MEIEKIKDTITKHYIHGAFNETDIESFKTIFHPQFAITNIRDDGPFFLFTRDMWEEVLRKRLEDPAFDFSTVALTPHYRVIDLEEQSASVSLDLIRADKVIYTDFLLLKQLNGDWKVVSKIFHEHASTLG